MHDEALTKNAAAFVPGLTRFADFYLAGGTALALQIGHRRSVDFDMFSEKHLPAGLLQKFKRVFPKKQTTVTYRSPEQLNLIADGVKVTFFHFDYPVIEPFVKYKTLPLASVKEIAAMKAFSIGKRLSYKDYTDWYFMLKENRITITEVIALAEKKFDGDWNDRLFLGQLVSLADVPDQSIDFLRGDVSRNTIAQFLDAAVKNYRF